MLDCSLICVQYNSLFVVLVGVIVILVVDRKGRRRRRLLVLGSTEIRSGLHAPMKLYVVPTFEKTARLGLIYLLPCPIVEVA